MTYYISAPGALPAPVRHAAAAPGHGAAVEGAAYVAAMYRSALRNLSNGLALADAAAAHLVAVGRHPREAAQLAAHVRAARHVAMLYFPYAEAAAMIGGPVSAPAR